MHFISFIYLKSVIRLKENQCFFLLNIFLCYGTAPTCVFLCVLHMSYYACWTISDGPCRFMSVSENVRISIWPQDLSQQLNQSKSQSSQSTFSLGLQLFHLTLFHVYGEYSLFFTIILINYCNSVDNILHECCHIHHIETIKCST